MIKARELESNSAPETPPVSELKSLLESAESTAGELTPNQLAGMDKKQLGNKRGQLINLREQLLRARAELENDVEALDNPDYGEISRTLGEVDDALDKVEGWVAQGDNLRESMRTEKETKNKVTELQKQLRGLSDEKEIIKSRIELGLILGEDGSRRMDGIEEEFERISEQLEILTGPNN